MYTTSLIQLKLFNFYRTEFEIDKYKELPKDNKLVQIHFIQMQLILITQKIGEYLISELESKPWVNSKHIKVIHGVECLIHNP